LSAEEQMIEARMHNVEGLCPVDCNTSTKIASQMLAAAAIGGVESNIKPYVSLEGTRTGLIDL